MPTQRQLFFSNLAQTSPEPPAIEFSSAAGIFLTDVAGKKYFDLISGISVSSLGHHHPSIDTAIHEQIDRHLHIMVYGEFILKPQVQLASNLAGVLPDSLSTVYLTNSGAEATEGAMKLAKRFTGRTDFVSFKNSYHGSTQGALSVCGDNYLKSGYYPLLPGCHTLDYNDFDGLNKINRSIAAVFVEPVQAEAGVILPKIGFLKALRKKCTEQNVLLIFDEIQTGMGRTGEFFAFMHELVVPDILLLGKSFGGGMPLGAFISSAEIMKVLSHDPFLGHLTTFGGHPVSCAASNAVFRILAESKVINSVKSKELLFRSCLIHPGIVEFRSSGLLMALRFESEHVAKNIIKRCMEKGVVTDWFLFAADCLRLAPPLIITEEQIRTVCILILEAISEELG